MSSDEGTITRLLAGVERGDPDAERLLFARVYEELKGIARHRLASDRDVEDDGATALVHDAYVRLAGEEFENRRHLFFAYAQTMKRILVDRARKARASKRGGDLGRVPFHESLGSEAGDTHAALDALDIERLLGKLRETDARKAEVVELHFFGGLRHEDIAEVMGVDARTVRRDWRDARDKLAAWAR